MTPPALYGLGVVLPAAVLDWLLGDPRWLPHPVRWMGRAIAAWEAPLRRRFPKPAAGERGAGALLVLLMPPAVRGRERSAAGPV